MTRQALIVGINHYREMEDLRACVADAESIASTLATHKDDTCNFLCTIWPGITNAGEEITRSRLRGAIRQLFKSDGDVVLYFAGHGFASLSGGILGTSDSTPDDWGVQMQDVVDETIASAARQILIIIDCCHAGNLGNPGYLNAGRITPPIAVLRENTTLMLASRSTENAYEENGHGMFTAALVDGLEGGAADHMGFVSAPALYTYARRRFSASPQSPVFKTNSTEVFQIRECAPLIARFELQRLLDFFPQIDCKFQLDPDYEPEDEHGNMKQPVDMKKLEVARLFKVYRDAGLLTSTEVGLQFFWVARHNKTVELTARGQEYWWLVSNGKV
jgi:hypothetical protein